MLIPKNRHEYYLAVISGNDYPTFPPKTREELYLAKLAGREVDVPIPKTPKERAYYNIINDIKFEPENRWQTFVAAANDDSITAPIPRTREEIWWANISLSHEVIVEYVGTLPATLQTVEGYLESYKIYGNTVQDGTPTPENPIEPQECGERTENLFDKSSDVVGYYIALDSGKWTQTESTSRSIIIKCEPNTTYTIFVPTNRTLRAVYFYNYPSVGDIGYGYTKNTTEDYINKTMTITTNSSAQYLAFFCYNSSQEATMYDEAEYFSQIMLNLGSTALPYEPYGYKLPLAVNGVEYPIYLGENRTTRRIEKLVLRGTSVDGNTDITAQGVIFITPVTTLKTASNGYCTHYKFFDRSQGPSMPLNSFTTNGGAGRSLWFKTEFDNVADFKTYLAAQYAAGTPVTVWYVLAEPETGIVNEPLMKIGDYADTVSMEQAGVSIPTFAGTTVIDYDGTPKPDKVELTYKTVKRAYISSDDEVYQDPNGQLLGG